MGQPRGMCGLLRTCGYAQRRLSRRSSTLKSVGRILAIDDEAAMLRTVQRILRDHEVVCVEDAQEVVGILDRGEQFDLILCDVTMPLMTGMELYERLLAKHPEAARSIVFLSGGAVNARTAEFLADVRNASLAKPILPAALRSFVQDYLAARASAV